MENHQDYDLTIHAYTFGDESVENIWKNRCLSGATPYKSHRDLLQKKSHLAAPQRRTSWRSWVQQIPTDVFPGYRIIPTGTTGPPDDVDPEAGQEALDKIEDITADPEMGEIYTGTVVKTMDFGAFVNFMGKKDGLVHISELSDRRVRRTTDIVKVGDKVKVKVVGFDNRGKIKLSMKEIKQNNKNFNRA